ncbi:MAG: hypothetical protein K2X93_12570 [Candidatus Obscuribacterales bacterium]|nr:hypothetical protein [Candidatus Obscuribacterales bacterium]
MHAPIKLLQLCRLKTLQPPKHLSLPDTGERAMTGSKQPRVAIRFASYRPSLLPRRLEDDHKKALKNKRNRNYKKDPMHKFEL